MRLKHFSIICIATCLLTAGCSARSSGRLGSGLQNWSGSANTAYDNDPPGSRNSGRIAIQPSPVPPARGISHVRQISHQKVHQATTSRCVDESCAVEPHCAAPRNCTAQPHCAAPMTCGDNCCNQQRRGFLACLGDMCHKDGCCDESCTPQPHCAAPPCPPNACGEQKCCVDEPWCKRWRFLSDARRECSAEPRCGDDGCAAPRQDCCSEPEGCCDRCDNRRGLLTCLLELITHNPYCRVNPRWGAYCSPRCSAPCAEQPCVPNHCGEGCGTSQGCIADRCPPGHCQSTSPLADCLLGDPFVEHESAQPIIEHPVSEEPTRVIQPEPAPPAPMPSFRAPAAPIEQTQPESIPEPINTLRGVQPLSPVPSPFSRQAFVEPQIWPRLKADWPGNRAGTRMAETHTTTWRN